MEFLQGRAAQVAAAVRSTGTRAPDEVGPAHEPGGNDLADRVCRAVADLPGVQGASVCVLFMPKMSIPAGVSDAMAARAEELQFSTGEGACWQAYRSGGVVAADLTDAVSERRWPAYASAVRREVAYAGVVAIPVTLSGGLLVVLNVYGPVDDSDRWWEAADGVAQALKEVLTRPATLVGWNGADWLDASSTLRRGVVWAAEAVMVEQQGWLHHDSAQEAMRTFSVVEGGTVDEVAAALIAGHVTVLDVLGKIGQTS